MSSKYSLAETYASRMISGAVSDPHQEKFVENLKQVNELADNTKSFV